MNRFWQQLAIATNWPILAAIAVLVALGCLSIGADAGADVRKQLVFLGVGLCGMLLFQGINYQELGRYSWPLYVVSLVLLIYTITPGVPQRGFFGVPRINGARAWIMLGPVQFEPAELMKLAFCMVLARYLRYRSNYRTLGGLVAPFALALGPVLIILKQPALGMALLFIPTLFAMLYVAGARLKHLIGVIVLCGAMVPVAYLSGSDVPFFRHLPPLLKEYQRKRVQALISHNPHEAQGIDFQQEQALTAFGSGGWTGKGIGNIPVGSRVPEAHNDMIFALLGEQLGFGGVAAVLFAYVVLFTAGLEIASANREPFGKLLAVGIVTMLTAQTFLNLTVTLRLMPVTGITLPFVSYGGSSLLASFMAAGLLLNVGQNRPIVMAKDAFEFG